MDKRIADARTGVIAAARSMTTGMKIFLWVVIFSILSINGFAQNGGYEGDVTPRPNGKKGAIVSADYQQIGRFATGLETTSSANEFQRADCAPRNTLGDGKIGIADLVQAMRYQSGLDPLTPTGGPTTPVTESAVPSIQTEAAREVKIGTPTYGVGTVTIPIEIVAQGDENALGFTLAFDNNALSNPNIVLGSDATNALLLLNSTAVLSGRVGVGLALPPGATLAAGTRQLLKVTFNIASAAYGTQTPIGFASSPVQLEISDPLGNLLSQRIFTGSSVTLLNPTPALVSYNPANAFVYGPSFTLTVAGTNFVNGAVIRWNGVALQTTYISNTSLSAIVPAANLNTADSIKITVFNPTPGGGESNALFFPILNPVPTVGSLGITTLAAGGGAGSIDVFGTNFVPGSTVYWNGRALATRYISPTRLIVDYAASDIACAMFMKVTVVSPTPGGGTSVSFQTLTISPSITALNPTIAYVGGSNFTLTVTGTGFCDGARIRWNGVARNSAVISGTQITTTITTADLANPATIPISVISSDGVVSNNLNFTVSACTPAQAKVTLSSAIDLGTATPARGLIPLSLRQFGTFTVENTGCQALSVNFNVRRTGTDVDSGKITNTDDSATFVITNANGVVINTGTNVTVAGFGKETYRVYFDPKIPAPAGATTNLAANQIIPDLINSILRIQTGSTVLASSTLTGRVETNSRFINPLAPRLEPLVLFSKTADDQYTVEISGYDPNSNIYLFSYQFYDANGNRIGEAPGFDLDLIKLGILKGQAFTIIKKFTANECGRNAATVQAFFYDREDYAYATSLPIGTGRGRVINATSVSAASYQPSGLASESIAAAFGEKFGDETAAAPSTPLPTELANVKIFVTDSNKVERMAPLFYVSPTQINYQIPEGTADGNAKVAIAYKGEVVSSGTMSINHMAPGLFTANSDGSGVPAAYAVRVKSDNSQTNESVYQYDSLQNKFVPAPINMGAPDEQIFLVLFGTGIRNNGGLSSVSAKIAGVDAEVVYAGAQGTFVGVDQVNLRIPRSLMVSGEVDLELTVDGMKANPVRIFVR